jgi:photosystem II stability/assembly factor-like uncharacterized protein
LRVAGADNLDFRGIQGFGAELAYVMSSGNGDKSRIYQTSDGGKSWQLQYTSSQPGFFLDALACASKRECTALSDPVEGKFLVLDTGDGEHWRELPRAGMPAALSGEGAFAASNSALARCSGGTIYFGTGGATTARVFVSHDYGRTWKAVATPISGAPSRGIFSVTCPERRHLVAVGGDYQNPGQARQAAIYSQDDGKSWHLAEQQPGGYRSAVDSCRRGRFAAVGPNGTDLSLDYGIHWTPTDHLSLNAVSFAGTEGWAVGAKGTVARFHISGLR